MDLNISKALKEITDDEGIAEFEIKDAPGVVAGDNFLGAIRSIIIKGVKKNDRKTVILHLISKSATKSINMRNMMPIRQVYLREVHSYCKTLPALKMIQQKYNLPANSQFAFTKCYKAIDLEYEELVILENLKVDGFTLHSRREPLHLEHTKLVMKNLGYLHSLSFALKNYEPELYEEIADNIKNDTAYSNNYKRLVVKMQNLAQMYVSDKHKKWFQSYSDGMYDVVYNSIQSETSAPYNVFCHGDCWQNNVLFKYKDERPVELRLIDWQMVKHCSPVIDISHLIFSSTDGNLRKDHYRELLDIYYESIVDNLKSMNCDPEECYPRKVFRQQLRDILPYGFVLSVISLTLLMREEDEILDSEAMADDFAASREFNMEFKNQTSVKKYTERLNSVISDFVDLMGF